MSQTTLEVGPGTRVHLNFELRLKSGELIDSNLERDPVKFEVGDSSLLFGFEKRLFGLTAGEQRVFDVPASEGFGEHNPDNIQKIPADQFGEVDPQPGMILGFSDPAQGEVPGVILGVEEKYVEVDFNHPLAGRDLQFEVHIHAVEPASSH